ncbi:carbonic anhydrase [Chromobacterium sp. LK1]|uniref:carbonic anhydrase n=1 Tax=Chromobacterium sp. LK1 TaxID=1628193 RepID=UPI000A67AF22|nr:carbonic anhydrase [Chromobacterium sp. LK1]
MGMLGRKGRLALCLAMLMAQAWAEEAPSADGSQPKTVIKLPLKLKPQAAADAHKDEPAKPAAPVAKPEAKPAAKAEHQPEVKAAKAAEHPPEAKTAKPEAKPGAKPEVKAAAKPEVKAEAKAVAKPMASKPAEAKAPEKLEPAVKMSPPPVHKDLSQPSPEVHGPDSLRHAPRKRLVKRKPKPAAAAAGDMQAATLRQLQPLLASVAKAGHGLPGGQDARATLVSCSASRTPAKAERVGEGKQVLLVPSYGSQLAGAGGAVEYGVRQLHTPLLVFVSQADCEAVKLAASDYSQQSEAQQQALAAINIPKDIDATNGALLNINNQVEAAIMTFSGEVEAGRLAVVGAFYDVGNDLKQGRGKLVITNLNGETDPAKIRGMSRAGQYFKYSFMK